MKKTHRHDELSTRMCVDCGKALKSRLIWQKDVKCCYKCFCKKEAERGHTVNTQARKKRIINGLPVKIYA
jgi:hypothetical protein